jgi:hypothetical protein
MLVYAFGPELVELTNSRCKAKWGDSGLNTRFSFGVGCMVQVDGKWVPEANVQIRPKQNGWIQ